MNIVSTCTNMAEVLYKLELAEWSPRRGGKFYHQLRDYWVDQCINGSFGITL